MHNLLFFIFFPSLFVYLFSETVYCCQRQAVVLVGSELGGGLLHGSSGLCVGVPEQELAR